MSGISTPKKVLIFFAIIIFLFFSGNESVYSQENDKTDSANSIPRNFHYDAGEADNAGPAIRNVLPEFPESSLYLYNQLGNFGSVNNGIQGAFRNDHYGFSASYFYRNFDGYRVHSKEYWHDAKMALRTSPTANTSLTILGSYVNGMIRLPGALTKSEFSQDAYQADQRSIDRDEKSIAGKGKLEIRYDAKFGKSLNNQFRVDAFGETGLFECATREYRVISSQDFGIRIDYSNLSHFWNRDNKVTIGTGFSVKPQRTEYYDNIGGTRGDQMEQLSSEKTSSTGFYLSDRFEILPKKLFIFLHGRYDDLVYKVSEQTVPSRSQRRPFKSLTPEVTIDYNILKWFGLFASYNLGFESPADKELESADPFFLFNPTLSAQTSTNIKGGINILLEEENKASLFREFRFNASAFRSFITNEIVPYEVFGDVFYRNAAKTNHFGLDVETRLVVFKELLFGISYIFSQFIYSSYPSISMETDTTGNLVQVPRDFSGKTEPAVPLHNLKLSLDYEYPVSKHISIKADFSYSAISGMWVDDANTEMTSAYNLLNGFLEYRMKFGHFNMLFSGGLNNILNTVYAGFINTNSANNRFYVAGAPRNWAVVLNLGYTF